MLVIAILALLINACKQTIKDGLSVLNIMDPMDGFVRDLATSATLKFRKPERGAANMEVLPLQKIFAKINSRKKIVSKKIRDHLRCL
jgi:hypothetical protein